MKKKLFKWVVIPIITFLSASSLTSFASADEWTGYCWSTYFVFMGIAVCDGPPGDCVHPC